MKKVLTACAVLIALILPVGVGAAERPPRNDDITRATRVSSLPFSETVDLERATSDDADPLCRNTRHTVWFKYTPHSDMRLIARVRARRKVAESVSVWTKSADTLTAVECRDYQPLFEATAGTTYFFMVGTRGNRVGKVRFRLDEAPPPPSLTISVDPDVTVSPATEALTVTGTLACTETQYASYYGSVRQVFEERQFITAWFDDYNLECEAESQPWATTVLGDGIFIDGPGFVEIETYTCSRIECVEEHQIVTVSIHRE